MVWDSLPIPSSPHLTQVHLRLQKGWADPGRAQEGMGAPSSPTALPQLWWLRCPGSSQGKQDKVRLARTASGPLESNPAPAPESL